CQCWADHQTFYRAIRFYWLAAAAVLHFKPNLKLLFWQKNWNFDALRETGARAFSIAKFAVNKDVHCPLDQVGKVVRDQQREFSGILRCIVKAETVFSRNCGIEGKLVPIRQRVTRFESEAALKSVSFGMFDLVLHSDSEAGRQPHFDFLPQKL